MSEPLRPQLAFLGLPRTGKSTYLGAFWAVVESPMAPNVHVQDVTGDRAYLDFLRDEVAQGNEIERTEVGSEDELRLSLGFDPGGDAELVIPDLSGESLRILIEHRYWSESLLDSCRDATAILLFVHPDKLRQPMPLSVIPADTPVPTEPKEPAEGAVDFDITKHSCTAAELIDALENVLELLKDQWPVRVGVVISAWDRSDEPTPDEWMRTRLPGVLAVAETNPDSIEFNVFGVSAQGGALGDREALLAKGEIIDRAFAKDRAGADVSLIEPIRWAIWGS